MQLSIYDQLPPGLLEKHATALHQQLPGPSLISISGENPQPLFISVLQHGNEDTGWEAVRNLLKHRYSERPLPRSIELFIGNVAAARLQARRLDEQPDLNRCWPYSGRTGITANSYTRLCHQVTDRVRKKSPFAAIDIHNNTGLNPHYGAINFQQNQHYNLARLFSDLVTYFEVPKGTCAATFGEFCPSVTLECGQAGQIHGTDHALEFLEHCLHLETIDTTRPDSKALYHMLATVYVSPGLPFSFLPEQAPLSFIDNLDHYNFRHLPAGTLLAHQQEQISPCLLALDHDGQDITDECFIFSNNMVRTKRPLMPSMLTPDARVIRQDCLCYLMERIDLVE